VTPMELATLRDRIARARVGLEAGVSATVLSQRERWREERQRRINRGHRYRCVYCGEKLRDKHGRFGKRLGLACPKHVDLVNCDPKFTVAV